MLVAGEFDLLAVVLSRNHGRLAFSQNWFERSSSSQVELTSSVE